MSRVSYSYVFVLASISWFPFHLSLRFTNFSDRRRPLFVSYNMCTFVMACHETCTSHWMTRHRTEPKSALWYSQKVEVQCSSHPKVAKLIKSGGSKKNKWKETKNIEHHYHDNSVKLWKKEEKINCWQSRSLLNCVPMSIATSTMRTRYS